MTKQIMINGPIISDGEKWFYDYFDEPATCAKDIRDGLPVDNSDVEILINSGGGDVFAGSEIFTILKEYSGKIVAKVTGFAASAASVIAMGADEIQISPTAQMMIHNVSRGVYGDHNAVRHEADLLENYNVSIANAYVMKTGKTIEEVTDLMNKETWYNAQQAVEAGFADKVMFSEEVPKLVASVSNMIPEKFINEFKVLKQKADAKNSVDVNVDTKDLEKIIADLKETLKNEQNKKPKEEPTKNNFSRFFF